MMSTTNITNNSDSGVIKNNNNDQKLQKSRSVRFSKIMLEINHMEDLASVDDDKMTKIISTTKTAAVKIEFDMSEFDNNNNCLFAKSVGNEMNNENGNNMENNNSGTATYNNNGDDETYYGYSEGDASTIFEAEDTDWLFHQLTMAQQSSTNVHKRGSLLFYTGVNDGSDGTSRDSLYMIINNHHKRRDSSFTLGNDDGDNDDSTVQSFCSNDSGNEDKEEATNKNHDINRMFNLLSTMSDEGDAVDYLTVSVRKDSLYKMVNGHKST